MARTAEAIDPTTRTLLTEVDVPNKDGKLLPGSFGEVHFNPKIDAEKVTVPVNAMLFRQEGPQVAVVGSDSKVQLRHITIGRDYGTTLEIVGGVNENDRIIVNPSDSIEEGQKVNVAAAPTGRPAVVKRLALSPHGCGWPARRMCCRSELPSAIAPAPAPDGVQDAGAMAGGCS